MSGIDLQLLWDVKAEFDIESGSSFARNALILGWAAHRVKCLLDISVQSRYAGIVTRVLTQSVDHACAVFA